MKTLIGLVTSASILAYPDLKQPFELEVDTSAFTVGAILFQRDAEGYKHDVGYFLKALNPAE